MFNDTCKMSVATLPRKNIGGTAMSQTLALSFSNQVEFEYRHIIRYVHVKAIISRIFLII